MMRSHLLSCALGLLGLGIFVGILGLAGAAHAEPVRPLDRPGIDLAVRVGYAIPFGDISGDAGNGLASRVDSAVPFVLEAGYRFDAALTLGLYFQYGFLQINDNFCGANNDCSGSVIRLGIEGLYHFDLHKPIVPWAGLGVGYEWGNIDTSSALGNGSESANGWEFLTLQAGGDFHLLPQIAVGPYVSFSVARYGSGSGRFGNINFSGDITNPAVHEWLQLGVRGSFGL
ncbi:MAG TPA: outer membrane beta-barrel protein [Polyangia bacterium]|nr:outer membrane beta-barrel protein [Polyangia bacterium]